MKNSYLEPQTAAHPDPPGAKAFPPSYPHSLKESTELGETALWHENLHINDEKKLPAENKKAEISRNTNPQ